MKKRKTVYLGHVIQNNIEKLLKSMQRGLGRRKHSWSKNVRD